VLYAWIGSTMIWYLPSLVVFATLLLFGGCAHSLRVLGERAGVASARGVEILTAGVFLLFFSANAYTLNLGESRDPTRPWVYPRDARGGNWNEKEHERYTGYRAAAEFLDANAPQSGSALISEVGVFGYFYGGPVIDAVGLCTPEALDFYPPPEWDIFDEAGRYRTTANNFAPTEMVMTLRPGFVVNSEVYMRNLLRADSPFAGAYRHLADVGTAWGRPVGVYQRVDSRTDP